MLCLKEERELSQQCLKINQEVKNKTILNKSQGKKIRGFSTNCHNYSRSKKIYSLAEKIFKDQLTLNHLSDFIHEHQVKVKDITGKSHNYHIDFYFPKQKIAIEINPMFHYSYVPVAIRDQLRAQILKRNGIRTINIKVKVKQLPHSQLTILDKEDTRKAIKLLKSLKRSLSCEILDYYA